LLFFESLSNTVLRIVVKRGLTDLDVSEVGDLSIHHLLAVLVVDTSPRSQSFLVRRQEAGATHKTEDYC